MPPDTSINEHFRMFSSFNLLITSLTSSGDMLSSITISAPFLTHSIASSSVSTSISIFLEKLVFVLALRRASKGFSHVAM